MIEQQQRDEPPRDREGALHRAGRGGRVRGDHPGYVMRRSLYTRASLHPTLTGAATAMAGVAVLAWLCSGGSRRDVSSLRL